MGISGAIWTDPAQYLRRMAPEPGARTRPIREAHLHPAPEGPVAFFAPEVLQATAHRFRAGFPGLVTYAVKANPDERVIQTLKGAGISGFDVASPAEIRLIRRLVPGAVLHYNNPVRSRAEIAEGVSASVTSWSVDAASELAKLFDLVPPTCEIAVRFKLPVRGGAYDFGTKFGAEPARAAELLRAVAARGYRPALTFHPGTQCPDPQAWAAYVDAAAGMARGAGVPLARLNVGGGFPARRDSGAPPPLEQFFDMIAARTRAAFGADAPALVCEPGRAMVAESVSIAARVKALRDGHDIFLDDGIYGALAEFPLMGVVGRIDVLTPDGTPRRGVPAPRVLFGPTCDSIDRLPGTVPLPADLAEGDWLVFHGMGAYSTVTATRFNGYGALTQAVVLRLHG